MAGLPFFAGEERRSSRHGNLDPAAREGGGGRPGHARRGEGPDSGRSQEDARRRADDRSARAEVRRDSDEPSSKSPADRRAGGTGPGPTGGSDRDRRALPGRRPARNPAGGREAEDETGSPGGAHASSRKAARVSPYRTFERSHGDEEGGAGAHRVRTRDPETPRDSDVDAHRQGPRGAVKRELTNPGRVHPLKARRSGGPSPPFGKRTGSRLDVDRAELLPEPRFRSPLHGLSETPARAAGGESGRRTLRDGVEAAAGEALEERLLRVEGGLAGRWNAAHVGAVGVQVAGAAVVLGDRVEDFLADLLLRLLVQDRDHQLDAAIEVAGHPVGARNGDLLLLADTEGEAAAVLEKPSDDGRDRDPVGNSGHARPEAADPANSEGDRHSRAGSPVEGVDQLRVHEGVHLGDNPRRPSLTRLLRLAIDQRQDLLVKRERGDGQALVACAPGEARQVIEELRRVRAEFRARGEES